MRGPAAQPVCARSHATARFQICRKPAQTRTRNDGDRARHAWSSTARLRSRRQIDRIAYGEWEGLTLQEIETQSASVLSARERDKWDFAPPGGESYRELADRIGQWYGSLTADSVVAAHGGGVRALMAILNIVSEEQATRAQIEQGVIYVFADGKMSRYA